MTEQLYFEINEALRGRNLLLYHLVDDIDFSCHLRITVLVPVGQRQSQEELDDVEPGHQQRPGAYCPARTS